MESKRCGWKANFVDEKQTLWVVGCWRKPNCVVGLTIGVIRNCLGGLTIGVESTVEVVLYLNYQTLRTTHTQYSTTFLPFARGVSTLIFSTFQPFAKGSHFFDFWTFRLFGRDIYFHFLYLSTCCQGISTLIFSTFSTI